MPPGQTVGTRKDTIFVGLGARGFVAIQPGSADAAFLEALDALPASGGVLYVMPGTAPYVFQNAVVVSKPDVRIEFQGGPNVGGSTPTSHLAFPSSGGPKQLFRIEAPRFRCQGASVVHAAANGAGADDDRSCFLVQGADDAHFESCLFDLTQGSGNISGFSAIRAQGASSAAPSAGFTMSECSFIIRSGSRLDTTSGTGPPKGVVCIRAEDVDQVRILDCLVRGITSMLRETYCGSVIFLDNCSGSVIADLSVRFVDLRSSLASLASDSAVRLTTHGEAEGHRSVLARCLFEDIGTRSVIELSDARADVVAYANFGRILPLAENSIEIRGPRSQCVVVHGVNFHNVSGTGLVPPPTPNYMLDLKEGRSITLAGNVFKPFNDKQAYLSTAPGGCSGVVVGPSTSQLAQ